MFYNVTDGNYYPVHVLEKETVYMKNNMEIKITEIKKMIYNRVIKLCCNIITEVDCCC